MKVIIDYEKAIKAANRIYRGFGMVSANNSSRLLMDYRALHYDTYLKLLELIFGKSGLNVSYLKIEMGADINSSSGTEPAVMRSRDEKPDVTRGAGYILAADALKINPDLKLDMLRWSEPAWVSKADDLYEARYEWYKKTLEGAYDKYGLKFDYVSASRNERPYDISWIKYLRNRLDEEKDSRYDYSKILLAGADECDVFNIPGDMIRDNALMRAISLVGAHYTSELDEDGELIRDNSGKEIVMSEGSPAMGYTYGIARFDGMGGIGTMGGALDIANRLIGMIANAGMTMCEFQPIISAYYDGVTYCRKQFINACDPWSGYYSLDTGYFIMLHFTRFIKPGWLFIENACAMDGVKGGDGHCIKDACYSYLTAKSPNTDDFSMVVVNSCSMIREYDITLPAQLEKASLTLWESSGPDNFLDKRSVRPENLSIRLLVMPYSIVTLTTLSEEETSAEIPFDHAISKGPEDVKMRPVMPLPYCEDFSYSLFPDNFLEERGMAPLFTTDQGGAFEVGPGIDDDNACLIQQITPDIKAEEWGSTPKPVTCLGDDRWFNYSVSADVTLAGDTRECYQGIGIRYTLCNEGVSGYRLLIYGNGSYELLLADRIISAGSVSDFTGKAQLYLAAVNSTLTARINRNIVYFMDHTGAMAPAGRAALYSSYHRNAFANLKILPTQGDYSITRYDDTDEIISYEGAWNHDTVGSYRNYMRSSSTGRTGDSFVITFRGKMITLIGRNMPEDEYSTQTAVIDIDLDGERFTSAYKIPKTDYREAFIMLTDLLDSEHVMKVRIISGSLTLDSIECSRP